MDYVTLGSLLPRYFRAIGDPTRDCSGLEIGKYAVRRVQWAPDFYAIPGCLSLHQDSEHADNYKVKGLYPMDIASSLAIVVLDPSVNVPVNVLDLCCCPGSKLNSIAERLAPGSVMVGVDVSETRLNVCKSLLRSWNEPLLRYRLRNGARQLIFQCDGTTFHSKAVGKLVYDSNITNDEVTRFGSIKKRNKSYKDREQKRLRLVESSISSTAAVNIGDDGDEEGVSVPNIDNFDFVLVDAECTHDASYKHMQFISSSLEMHEQIHDKALTKPQASLTHGTDTVDNASTSSLRTLQQSLLYNGFRNLKPGGMLVYSTCSQAREQNEDIVNWLLSTATDAELVPVLDILRRVLPPHTTTPPSAESSDYGLGSDEFCFQLSADSACPLRLLQMELPELMQTVRTNYPTEESRKALSFAICEAVTQQSRPVVAESQLLPGTVKLSYHGGMSGHYIAKIRKLA